MRYQSLLIGSVVALAFLAQAQDLSTTLRPRTPNSGKPNVPSAFRQGGDTFDDAVTITGLPHETTGSTTGYNDDYDEVCPYSGSTAPDVVYTFTPATSAEIDIDMLGSQYDTKIYVYDQNLALVACNDDFYPDYVSKIEAMPVLNGMQYYVVIDGYGGAHGEYVLSVAERDVDPCVIYVDNARLEDEPPLEEDYVDSYNGGCNSPDFGDPFQKLLAHTTLGSMAFEGHSGWFTEQGVSSRDTDWFILRFGSDGLISITIDAEEAVRLFELAPQDCNEVGVVQNVTAGPCAPGAMQLTGSPGSEVWIWVGPQLFASPGGQPVHEFVYGLWIDGLYVPSLNLDPDDDYTFRAPRLEYPFTSVRMDADSTSADDVDLAELCGGESTPGPDLFATLYLEAGEVTGGYLYPFWYAELGEPVTRMNRVCLSVVSDLRHPEATCLGYQCADNYNQHFFIDAPVQSGWYYLVTDFTEPGDRNAWASFSMSGSSPPTAPAHDTCAGAILIPPGSVDIIDDLTTATNTVDPGRDGCLDAADLCYTGRDVVYRVQFTAGRTLDITMVGDGDWEEALYLVHDCQVPLGNCVASATPAGDGVNLRYTALEDETLWLVCDSWDVGPRPFTLTGTLGDVTDAPTVTGAPLALKAAPNPFNPSTTFNYELPRAGHARLCVYDLAGRLVATLVDAPRQAGRHTVTWRTTGRALPSGSYLARLEAGGGVQAIRIALLK